jgi:hypothetical protein
VIFVANARTFVKARDQKIFARRRFLDTIDRHCLLIETGGIDRTIKSLLKK